MTLVVSLSLLSGFVANSLSQLLVGSAVLNEMGMDCASSKCVVLRTFDLLRGLGNQRES